MSNDSENKKHEWKGLLVGVFVVILVLLIVFCWFLLQGKETHISEEPNSGTSTAIECSGNDIEDAFFVNSDGASSHTVKGFFVDGKLKKISYNYDAEYSSDEAAETANAVLHGNYNKYMASESLNPESLIPTFSNNGNRVKIDLITSADKLTNDNSLFFFLNMDDFQHIKNYDPEKLVSIYNGKGFSCEIHD